jgi:hypothetical protein
MHARRNRSEWQKIVREFERSEQTQAAFCESRGINVGSFRGWLYRLRRAAPAGAVALVPVDVTPARRSFDADAPVIVRVADVEICVPHGTDALYVARLVAELRRC